jgi:hypothetical protein
MSGVFPQQISVFAEKTNMQNPTKRKKQTYVTIDTEKCKQLKYSRTTIIIWHEI